MLLSQNQTLFTAVKDFFSNVSAYSSDKEADVRLKRLGLAYDVKERTQKDGSLIQKVRIIESRNNRNDYTKTILEGTFKDGFVASDLVARIYTDGFGCMQKRIETYDKNDKLTKTVVQERLLRTTQQYEESHKKGNPKIEDLQIKYLKMAALAVVIAAATAVLVHSGCANTNKGRADSSYQRQ